MDALGLIETKGLLPAIECADVMLKAAQVELLGRTLVGGGLVTVCVTGDVGAVKASVEAGAAAVLKIGDSLLISQHVIPRPHREIDTAILADEMAELHKTAGPDRDDSPDGSDGQQMLENFNPTESEMVTDEAESTHMPAPVDGETTRQMEQENPDLVYAKEQLLEFSKTDVDMLITVHGLDAVIPVLKKIPVRALRHLSREYDGMELAGRELSRANKATLLRLLVDYYGTSPS
jgi:ethanolamine utilization protein EutM